ncbi:MAG: NADH-quinone oxidoreductase subunit NuoE family protein [Alphaproteobacteria bacterium]
MADVTAQDPAGIAARHGDQPSALIEILHDLQAAAGAIGEGDLRIIAERLNLSRAEVHGVMSFYHDFRREPAGTAIVKVCRGEACQAMGAARLVRAVCARYGIELGETSADGVTVEPVYCLGNCALSPAAMVNGELVGRADVARVDALVNREATS